MLGVLVSKRCDAMLMQSSNTQCLEEGVRSRREEGTSRIAQELVTCPCRGCSRLPVGSSTVEGTDTHLHLDHQRGHMKVVRVSPV
jgi:hypothetical protein